MKPPLSLSPEAVESFIGHLESLAIEAAARALQEDPTAPRATIHKVVIKLFSDSVRSQIKAYHQLHDAETAQEIIMQYKANMVGIICYVSNKTERLLLESERYSVQVSE